MTMTTINTPRKIAKRLNEQHAQYSAGFYSSEGGRFFAARVHNGALQVSDFDTWRNARNGETFRDHNGRDILTVTLEPHASLYVSDADAAVADARAAVAAETATPAAATPAAIDGNELRALMPHAPFNAALIAARLVMDAIARGYTVSVMDDYFGDGEWTVKRSTDPRVILAAMATTDGDRLRFRDADGASLGIVALIYENDCDVISDYTANDAMNALTVGASELADRLSNGGR